MKERLKAIWNHPYFNTGAVFAILSASLLLISNNISSSKYAGIEIIMIAAYIFAFNAVIYMLSAIINSFTKKKINVHIIGLILDLVIFGGILLRILNYKPSAGEEALSVQYSIVAYVAIIIGSFTFMFHTVMLIVNIIHNKIKSKGR